MLNDDELAFGFCHWDCRIDLVSPDVVGEEAESVLLENQFTQLQLFHQQIVLGSTWL
jgi:hypothetical protein